MKSRFRVYGRIDGSSSATVVVDRTAGLFTVRPFRRRREYTVPLATVAEIVVSRIVKAEIADRIRAKRARRAR